MPILEKKDKMTLLISNKSKKEFKTYLKNLDLDYLETIDNPILDKRIADHPDLSVFVLDKKTIVVDENVYAYYKENLPGIRVLKGSMVGEKYPQDALYNVVKFKNFYIHNDFTEKTIKDFLDKKGYDHLFVNQGYTRCSTIPLKNSILTSDFGIYKKLKDKISISLLPKDHIELDGFDQGFLGGCCGMLGDKRLVFNGNIKSLNSYDIIKKQCDIEKIEILYPQCKLLDTGSVIKIG